MFVGPCSAHAALVYPITRTRSHNALLHSNVAPSQSTDSPFQVNLTNPMTAMYLTIKPKLV